MDEMLVASPTAKAIRTFLSKPSHALALLGAEGLGKKRLALNVASQVLSTSVENLNSYPYFTLVGGDGKAITIEDIRTLRTVTSLKTLGRGSLRRTIVIADAHLMTNEAQNALLKLLEEPPVDTLLILTAIPDEGLLPTIMSRLTVVRIQLPSKDSCLKFFGQDYDAKIVERMYLLSGGRPGALASLLADDQTHPMVQAVETAKKLVAGGPFERLAMVNDLAKDKTAAGLLLDALSLVYHSLLTAAANKNEAAKVSRFQKVLSSINDFQELRRHNPNTKLLLTDLMWQL